MQFDYVLLQITHVVEVPEEAPQNYKFSYYGNPANILLDATGIITVS